jgi:hypothetical protein
MSLTDIVTVSITAATQTPTRVGFGTPLVTAYHTNYVDRARTYTTITGMTDDGFATTDPAVLAAQALFSQNPRPPSIIVGRTENDQEQKITITPIAANDTAYTVYVNGQAATFTSDATATVAEICTGLKTQIDALSEPVTTTDNTTDVDIEANTVADAFRFYVADRSLITQENVTPDLGGSSGIVNDIQAIQDANDDWYCLIPTNIGSAAVTAAAVYIETLQKVQSYSSADDAIYDSGSTTDIGAVLNTAGYARTFGMWHTKPLDQYIHAAWPGRCLPSDPGSITWAYNGPGSNSLSGVDATTLTETERLAIEAKAVNHYTTVAGLSVTRQGTMAEGSQSYIDITRSIDFIAQRMKEYVFGVISSADKVPYTNKGIGVIESQVRAVIDLSIDQGILANDPAPIITVPDVADVAAVDKADRILRNVEFDAVLAGAIHKVRISGRVSV